MSIAGTIESHKSTCVVELAEQLEDFVREAARQGVSLHAVEQYAHGMVHRMRHMALGMFIAAQGDGDLGESVVTDEGVALRRSARPVLRPLQTVFGRFDINAYVYARGPKKRIALRPVDVRMALPNGHASYLFEEFSQYFCVEQAFDRSLEAIERVLRQSLSKDTLERINRRVGEQAEAYLDELPAPPVEHEGELLVVTGDGKGVPLVKPELASVPIFDPDERRGNRRMATLASVYSVDRFVRRPEDKVFHSHREHQEAFARERLERILAGELAGVISGLRRMATLRGLSGKARSEIETVCGDFEHNASRMRYDEYLLRGYPIATGIIEGACRHLVKDRMERSGMRWSLPGAQAMLHVRAIHQSPDLNDFHEQRIRTEQTIQDPYRSLITTYQPCPA